MEFGIFLQSFIPRNRMEEWGEEHEWRSYKNDVAVTQKADENGWKYLWVVEHHFLHEYSHISQPEAFIPYLLAKTERIHVGSGIFNIVPPVNHPYKTAERVATLDLLGDGRFEFGVGRGSGTTEVGGFGIDDYPVTKEMFEEALPEILKMWEEGTYPGFDGKFWSSPARIILPKPLTKPHPPLWQAAGNAPTYGKVGRAGMGVLGFNVATFDQFVPLIASYKEGIAEAEPVGGFVNDNLAITGVLSIDEDGQRAREKALEMQLSYLRTNVFRYLDSFAVPGTIPPWPQVLPEVTLDDIERSIEDGTMICGDPDECVGQIQRYTDIGCDQLVFAFPLGLDIEDALSMIELFGREVIPRADPDPEFSTVRHRMALA